MAYPDLPWLDEKTVFPPVTEAWDIHTPLPGLLASGGVLTASTLHAAYQQGIFPWFSAGQPPLWWSPDPRMVLQVADFRLHRSLRKSFLKFLQTPGCSIRIDTSFQQVMEHCASTPRPGQDGTWIVPSIVHAYTELHHAGFAHSVETWMEDRLVGGLYCVALGRAVYGESMFAHVSNASKIALCALIALCRAQNVVQIDCQQATAHLAFLGAREIPRSQFFATAHAQQQLAPMTWRWHPEFASLLWP